MACQGCNRGKKDFFGRKVTKWPTIVEAHGQLYSLFSQDSRDYFNKYHMQDPTIDIEYAKNHANDRRNKGSTD